MRSIEKKRTLSRIAFAFAMALVVSSLGLYLYNIVKWSDYPDFGYGFRTATGIEFVGLVTDLGLKAGMQVGDRILKVNGKSFSDLHEFRAAMQRELGEKNTYLLEREGQNIQVIIPNTRLGFKGSFARSGLPFLVGLCFILIGVIVFLMKPHNRTSWIFFLFASTLGLFLTFLYKLGVMHPFWLETVNVFTYTFTPALFIHLAFYFPEERGILKRHPNAQILPYIASILLFFSICARTPTMTDAPKILLFLTVIYMALGVLVFIGSCLQLRLTSSSELVKIRSRMILLGVVIAASVPLADFVINTLFHIYILPSFNYYLPFIIFIPVCIAYSIIKHNLFDIGAVIRRTYGYFLSTFAISGAYTLFIFVPATISNRLELTMSPVYPLVLIIAVIFVINLTHHRVRKFIERVFYRLEYDYQETIQRISQTMASLLSMDQIEKGMMEIASNVLFIDKGFVMLLNRKEQVYENISVSPSKLKLPARDPLIQKISEGQRPVTLYDLEEDPLFEKERPACKKTLEQLEATLIVPIIYEDDLIGMICLGEKKSGRFYRKEDLNLLKTLASQGAVAIENAQSFEEIKGLNQELTGKKLELENTLDELQAAITKTEILESLKANLCKFVPTTVTKLLEKSPGAISLAAKQQDLSVMFLDIEGYTTITETMGATAVNNIVERYFSVFMDAIYENNGDVMETAGDSLMVLFLSDDKTMNALEAVRSALMIKDRTTLVNRESGLSSQPLMINIGIASDQAIVGASKFESYTGARWTYSATGMVVNLAARICAHATGGAVLVSRTTMERVKNHFFCKSIGKFELKNISKKMELFAIEEKAQN